MDAKYFDEIKAREQAATSGPWAIGNGSKKHGFNGANVIVAIKGGQPYVVMDRAIYPKEAKFNKQVLADIKYAAHARTDIPALIAEVERLTAENATTTETLKQVAKKYVAKGKENSTLKKALSEINQKLNAAESQIDDKCRQWQCVLQRVYDAGSFDKNSGLWKNIDEAKRKKRKSHFAAYKECIDMVMEIGQIADQYQAQQLAHETHGDASESSDPYA